MSVSNGQEQGLKRYFDVAIFTVVVIAIVAMLLFLLANFVEHSSSYKKAIDATSSGDVNHSALIVFLLSWNFGITRISVIFISFVIILIGALYVLRVAQSEFKASAKVEDRFQISLSTASPGLVMILLGTLLVVSSMYRESRVDYTSPKTEFSITDEPRRVVPQIPGTGK